MTSLLRRLRRHSGPAALVVATVAIVLSTTGLADAARKQLSGVRPNAVLRLNAKAKIPTRALPVVPRATRAVRAQTLNGRSDEELTGTCLPTSVDLGTWCLDAAVQPVANADVGRNDYFFATQACVDAGGYLPTAAQLIGAAEEVKLSSTIGDDQLTATVDNDPSDGLRDRREMSATLITAAAGSSAAGSQGVSDGSRGNPRVGEPDPTPFPATPAPETLQYVTVYDNGDRGGFAGAQPVVQPQSFRCAYDKLEGASEQGDEGGGTGEGGEATGDSGASTDAGSADSPSSSESTTSSDGDSSSDSGSSSGSTSSMGSGSTSRAAARR